MTSPVFAGTVKLSTSAPLRVGVSLQMPFAQNINGHYSGIAIDIWESIAHDNHWSYEYIPLTANIKTELVGVVNGNLDILIGPISVTNTRLQFVDFTRPFFLSSIAVVIKPKPYTFRSVMSLFLSNTLFVSIAILLGSFILFVSLLWYIEKGRLNYVFTHYYTALTKGIFLHTFRKGMSVPKAFYARLVLTPTALYSRILTILWIILAAAVFTTINASYIASMTISINKSKSTISHMRHLEVMKVAGVEGQSNVEIAESKGIYIHKTKDLNTAMNLLKTSQVDAVICDAPIGIEYLHTHESEGFEFSPFVIQNDEMAFAVPLNSPIKHLVDIGIVKLQDGDKVVKICKRYIGEDARRCDM